MSSPAAEQLGRAASNLIYDSFPNHLSGIEDTYVLQQRLSVFVGSYLALVPNCAFDLENVTHKDISEELEDFLTKNQEQLPAESVEFARDLVKTINLKKLTQSSESEFRKLAAFLDNQPNVRDVSNKLFDCSFKNSIKSLKSSFGPETQKLLQSIDELANEIMSSRGDRVSRNELRVKVSDIREKAMLENIQTIRSDETIFPIYVFGAGHLNSMITKLESTLN